MRDLAGGGGGHPLASDLSVPWFNISCVFLPFCKLYLLLDSKIAFLLQVAFLSSETTTVRDLAGASGGGGGGGHPLASDDSAPWEGKI